MSLIDQCQRVQLSQCMVAACLVFKRNYQTVFQSGCIILHSHWRYMSDPVSRHPCQHLELSLFFTLVILIGIQWYLVVSFIISLYPLCLTCGRVSQADLPAPELIFSCKHSVFYPIYSVLY